MDRALLKSLCAAAMAAAALLINASAESAATAAPAAVDRTLAAQQGQAACALPPSRKIDEYGEAGPEEMKARLDKFEAVMKGEPEDVKGVIVAYAGRAARAGDALKRADAAKEYLTEKSTSINQRLNTLDCGRRERATVELWIMPVAAAPPVCSPTVNAPAPGAGESKRRAASPARRSKN